MIKLLFECGADIDGIYPGEGPALVVAAYAKHMHIFHWLLVHGANAAIAKGCWDWMQLMPVELGMWAFAEETHSFGSVTGLLAEVPILQLARVCRHAIWEWEVLEFIRRAHTKATGAVNLESEIFLTTTAGGPRLAKFLDKRSRRGHTRAYTWNEMRLGLDPFVMGFVDRLLEHVADHLDETPEPLCKFTFQVINFSDGADGRHSIRVYICQPAYSGSGEIRRKPSHYGNLALRRHQKVS